MIKIEKISKQIGKFKIKDISLNIENGDYFVVLGPSGTGKTVLLEIIAGLRDVDSGEIYFSDELVNDVPPEKRKVGMVYQDYMLFPHLTVKENILFGIKLKRIKNYENKYLKLLNDLEISHLVDRSIRNLSGGEKQRISLARTLIMEPEMLLLDEPLSAVDTSTKNKLQNDLKRIHKEFKITTIHVTHDFNEAIFLADKIAIVKDGEVIQNGTPEEIFQKPCNDFVAEFIGCKNIFKGKVIEKNIVKISDIVNFSVVTGKEEDINLMIRSENIIISLNKFSSSAKNCFQGNIINIEKKLKMVEIDVDIGISLSVYVTYSSFELMKLEKGKSVYLTFKATSVHIY
ncbi:MAG: ABC transporter ATP-binding protein [Bacillota bacterium]|nr:ABC transporter ATP-binding protein [Bacillota bacterium]